MTMNTNTPHIDPTWAEDLVLELRLRNADGRAIGATLAEVEAHCAESGESAQDAFGDAREYAAALDLPASAKESPTAAIIPAFAGLSGMLATLAAVRAWRMHTQLDVSAGLLVTFLATLAAVVALAVYAAPALRSLVKHRWLPFVSPPVLVTLGAVPLFLWRDRLFTLPLIPTLVVSIALLALSTVLALRQGNPADLVQGPERLGRTGTIEMSRPVRLMAGLTPYLFPLLTALMCLPWLVLG